MIVGYPLEFQRDFRLIIMFIQTCDIFGHAVSTQNDIINYATAANKMAFQSHIEMQIENGIRTLNE